MEFVFHDLQDLTQFFQKKAEKAREEAQQSPGKFITKKWIEARKLEAHIYEQVVAVLSLTRFDGKETGK